jgi:hypothetical protein
MTVTALAAGYLVVANFFVALFQFSLALGAPLGHYAWGGSHSGKLPSKWRFASALSGFFLIAVAGHYASELGLVAPMLNASGRLAVLWVLTAFTALSTLGNYRSSSSHERRLFGPVAASMLLANLLLLGVGHLT